MNGAVSTTRAGWLKELKFDLVILHEYLDKGDANASAYDLSLGQHACGSARLKANHVLYALKHIQEFPAGLFDEPLPDLSRVPGYDVHPWDIQISGCGCSHHKKEA